MGIVRFVAFLRCDLALKFCSRPQRRSTSGAARFFNVVMWDFWSAACLTQVVGDEREGVLDLFDFRRAGIGAYARSVAYAVSHLEGEEEGCQEADHASPAGGLATLLWFNHMRTHSSAYRHSGLRCA